MWQAGPTAARPPARRAAETAGAGRGPRCGSFGRVAKGGGAKRVGRLRLRTQVQIYGSEKMYKLAMDSSRTVVVIKLRRTSALQVLAASHGFGPGPEEGDALRA